MGINGKTMAVLSLTKGGFETGKRISALFQGSTHFTLPAQNDGSASDIEGRLKEFVPSVFQKYSTLVFVMATGIVVRTIAPLLADKKTDPAVIVLDEKGKFAISLVSGHLGGANEAALEISRKAGSTPVITTSSDVNEKTAVDMIADRNGLIISDMDACRDITAMLVNDKPVALISDLPAKRPPYYLDSLKKAEGAVIITNRDNVKCQIPCVKLIPRDIVLGLGCKRDTSAPEMESFVLSELAKLNIDTRAVKTVASIDIKSDEKAIINIAEKLKAELVFYSGDELSEVAHLFKPSIFVKSVTGTTSVSEASAYIAGDRDGTMLVGKRINNGMTLSVFQCTGRELVI